MRKLFIEHPESVGESYTEHAGHSLWFAGRLFVAAMACTIHAAFPFLCTKTGSGIIQELYEKMVANRAGTWRKGHEADQPAE